ncbi:creatininase family protein [Pyrolobus fumarii]|nr:creatininase family protein [Pyrolobus fumarii]
MCGPCCPEYALRVTTLRGQRIAVLPLGSVEWHCSAPLGVDSVIAVEMATRLCRELNEVCGGAVLLPPLYYGASSEWSGYEELSIRRSTVARIVEELAASLERLGFNTLVLVNAHGGNSASLRYAVERLVYEKGTRLRVYIVEWWRLLGLHVGHMDVVEAGLASELMGLEEPPVCECKGLGNPYEGDVECRRVKASVEKGLAEKLWGMLKKVAGTICEGKRMD